ncbi:hypothetical protein C8R43DRAFT_91884 [Mycena crocata]|nr:hypothetical protein C8R43DRAFT_91884 [Mycena crocata]
MKLRGDKLADVQTPTLVRCLNCGTHIKLSPKSDYDASHWIRHRTRCVKKTKARELEKEMQLSPSSSATGSSPASSARALTPHDGEDEMDASQPIIPDPLDSGSRTHVFHTDYPIYHDWQSWQWSQLKSRFKAPKQLF